jgi:nicotinate-nucleotide pyrophosphorylase (carboxylating)
LRWGFRTYLIGTCIHSCGVLFRLGDCMKRTGTEETAPPDIRDEIFRGLEARKVTAAILADDEGIVAETNLAADESKRLGLKLLKILEEGSAVRPGDEIARFTGSPKQIVAAEDVLIGLMAKPSGIATAARAFVKEAGGRPEIVCGAWKKMPASQKASIRRALVVGGALIRISRDPFVYLDKNYIRILGGIGRSLEAVGHMADRRKVAQIKGRNGDIVTEAREAVESGADILHIDTGIAEDVESVVKELVRVGLRGRVRVAFSGNIRLEDLGALKGMDLDILDIGRQIVDAPLLDMRLEVIEAGGR